MSRLVPAQVLEKLNRSWGSSDLSEKPLLTINARRLPLIVRCRLHPGPHYRGDEQKHDGVAPPVSRGAGSPTAVWPA